jgi:hypothetical protein
MDWEQGKGRRPHHKREKKLKINEKSLTNDFE